MRDELTSNTMASKNREQIDQQFMQQALSVAQLGMEAGEVPVGAVLVRDDLILATAHNRTTIDKDPTAHAEMIVMREAASQGSHPRLDGATLYVTIEPCTMCAGALLQARIQRLVFGAREARTGAVLSIAETLMNPSNTHQISVSEGVLAEDAAALMQRFFAAKR